MARNRVAEPDLVEYAYSCAAGGPTGRRAHGAGRRLGALGLNGLGCNDERIHDLKQSGATTHFFADLRVKGGRLCVEGSAAGEETPVKACVATETGPFTPSKRKQ
jgi:hypothetical protein